MGKINQNKQARETVACLEKVKLRRTFAKSTNDYMSLMAFRMRGLARSWSADGQPLACRPCWP